MGNTNGARDFVFIARDVRCRGPQHMVFENILGDSCGISDDLEANISDGMCVVEESFIPMQMMVIRSIV